MSDSSQVSIRRSIPFIGPGSDVLELDPSASAGVAVPLDTLIDVSFTEGHAALEAVTLQNPPGEADVFLRTATIGLGAGNTGEGFTLVGGDRISLGLVGGSGFGLEADHVDHAIAHRR